MIKFVKNIKTWEKKYDICRDSPHIFNMAKCRNTNFEILYNSLHVSNFGTMCFIDSRENKISH